MRIKKIKEGKLTMIISRHELETMKEEPENNILRFYDNRSQIACYLIYAQHKEQNIPKTEEIIRNNKRLQIDLSCKPFKKVYAEFLWEQDYSTLFQNGILRRNDRGFHIHEIRLKR